MRKNAGIVHPDHPSLSVRIANGNARLAGDQDGAMLNVEVFNHLPSVGAFTRCMQSVL